MSPACFKYALSGNEVIICGGGSNFDLVSIFDLSSNLWKEQSSAEVQALTLPNVGPTMVSTVGDGEIYIYTGNRSIFALNDGGDGWEWIFDTGLRMDLFGDGDVAIQRRVYHEVGSDA